MGHFHPPNHDAGDANTVGGYHAVHSRPAAFEGKDHASYSVEIVVEATDDARRPYAAYFLFVRWGQGDLVAAGHLESAYLVHGPTEAGVRERLGAVPLSEAKRILDRLIDQSRPAERPWYDVMNDE